MIINRRNKLVFDGNAIKGENNISSIAISHDLLYVLDDIIANGKRYLNVSSPLLIDAIQSSDDNTRKFITMRVLQREVTSLEWGYILHAHNHIKSNTVKAKYLLSNNFSSCEVRALMEFGICGKKGDQSEMRKSISKSYDHIKSVDKKMFDTIAEVINDSYRKKLDLIKWSISSLDGYMFFISDPNIFRKYFLDRITKNQLKSSIRIIDARNELILLCNKIFELKSNHALGISFHHEHSKEVEAKYLRLQSFYEKKGKDIAYNARLLFMERPVLFDHLYTIFKYFPQGISKDDYVDSGFNGVILKIRGKDRVIKLTYNNIPTEEEELNHYIYKTGLDNLKKDLKGIDNFKIPTIYRNGVYEMDFINGSYTLQLIYIRYILLSQGTLSSQMQHLEMSR